MLQTASSFKDQVLTEKDIQKISGVVAKEVVVRIEKSLFANTQDQSG